MCVISSLSSSSLIPFMLACSIRRFLSLLLLGLCASVVSCGHPWSVCEVVLGPCVVGAVTVTCVLFV